MALAAHCMMVMLSTTMGSGSSGGLGAATSIWNVVASRFARVRKIHTVSERFP